MNITGAIFDLDGTLVDSLRVWRVIWNNLGKRFLNDPTFVADYEFEHAHHTMTFRETCIDIKEHFQLESPVDEIFEFFNEVITDFYCTKVEAKPGVAEWLEYLSQNGVKMCIASGSNRHWVESALKRCGFEKHFNKIFTCPEVGKNKAFPDIYEQALNYLGTPIETTWVFEDAPLALQTARNYGFKTVGISDAAHTDQQRVESLSDYYIAFEHSLIELIK